MEVISPFPKADIRIVRLEGGDVAHSTDHFKDFNEMVVGCHSMYPGIEKWVKSKVAPGIQSGERAAFVGYLDGRPVVTAVAKKGEDAKICHLKIADHLQNTNLGEIFFSLMGIELRGAKIKPTSAHFTLPESLWDTKHAFFESFGFSEVAAHLNQYRSFDPELRSQVSFNSMWTSILEKMPKLAHLYSIGGFTLDSSLLLSIQPKYSQLILSGHKTVELRRKFSKRWEGSYVNLYESAPTQGIVGEAKIQRIHHLSLKSTWATFQHCVGCTRSEYDLYTKGLDKVYAIELTDVKEYRSAVGIGWAAALLNEPLVAPQSYLTLEPGRPWTQAVSLAAYMHGCFQGVTKKAQAVRGPIKGKIINAKGVSTSDEQLPLPLIL